MKIFNYLNSALIFSILLGCGAIRNSDKNSDTKQQPWGPFAGAAAKAATANNGCTYVWLCSGTQSTTPEGKTTCSGDWIERRQCSGGGGGGGTHKAQ